MAIDNHNVTESRMTKMSTGEILWIYYNPFCPSKGQFVCNFLSPETILSVADKYEETPNFFLELETACRCKINNCKTKLVDFGDDAFEKILLTYSRSELMPSERSLVEFAKMNHASS